MQQPNDKYEENKSTPSQIPEQMCKKKKKKAKKSIHLVQLLSNNCSIDFQFHFKASFCSKMLIYSHSYTEKGHHCLFAWTVIVIQAEGLALGEKGAGRQFIPLLDSQWYVHGCKNVWGGAERGPLSSRTADTERYPNVKVSSTLGTQPKLFWSPPKPNKTK